MDGGDQGRDRPMRVSIELAAQRAARDVRTVQRWAQQGRISTYDDGTGRRTVDLVEVLRVEADIRERHKNRQKQRLAELFGTGEVDSVSL